ncbi:hypothetical protein HK098_007506 [Nowakowskiella sp. JEL0407]|nr:hypothetical protein HK098_007506 [Nowakowskiella sp. JEL0407]
MFVVGLTGGISTGKSTVSKLLKDLSTDNSRYNIGIVDADLIAREVVQPGKFAHRKTVKQFGTSIIDENKQIRRDKLGELVFSNESARRKLNACTHPAIRFEMLRQIVRYFLEGKRVVFLDTPLLFEAKLNKWVNYVVVVYCPRDLQKERLIKRDKLLPEAAEARINSQMSIEEKRDLANYVIDNSWSVDETREQTKLLLDHVTIKKISVNVTWFLLVGPASILYCVLECIKMIWKI